MGYPTASTIWPVSQPSDEVKQLIDRLFIVADTNTADSGERLAQEVFSPQGEFLSPQGTFTGSAEIRESRKHAWATVKSRHHVVSKVYMNSAQGADIILIGRLSTESVDGTAANIDFVARMVVEGTDKGARVREYRVISPPAQDPRRLLNEV